jgi:salicylate hydroxylase
MPASIKEESDRVSVAIIGGGIVGLVLAVGLLRRNIEVTVYEQAQGFREIGAGIAFTANAIKCMEQIDPDIVTALRSSGSVATSNGDETDPNDYLRWIDGYNKLDHDPHYQRMLYKIDAGYKGFEGCRRDQFLESLVKIISQGVIRCRKRLDNVHETEEGKIQLVFEDGSVAEADAGMSFLMFHYSVIPVKLTISLVIGCDGIKSRVRTMLFGENHPASHAGYTHKVAYRALIPMEDAIKALGEYKAKNQHNHVGPYAHLIHYPVANKKLINATAFVSDPKDWKQEKTTAPGEKGDLVSAFTDWNPCVRNIIDMFPEKIDKWAVFDLWHYPAPYYNKGRVCVAGDAAHASSPHHGAGACMGIEDGLCLSTLLEEVNMTIKNDPKAKIHALKTAFETYDAVRRTRSQWLVNSSRRVCDFYHQPEWAEKAKWVKAQTCFEELKDRSYKIWHFDYESMVQESIQRYKENVALSDGIEV